MAEPIYKYKAGCVECAVFENEKDGKKWRNFNVSRNFKIGEEWKSNSSFNLNDLDKIELCVAKCREWNYQNPISSE